MAIKRGAEKYMITKKCLQIHEKLYCTKCEQLAALLKQGKKHEKTSLIFGTYWNEISHLRFVNLTVVVYHLHGGNLLAHSLNKW